MKRATVLLILAALFALTAAGASLVYLFAVPTPLRIAVGPVGGEDTKLVVTILQTLAREKHPVRLRLVPTDGPLSSAQLLREGKADLAMVRSDGNIPPNAATIAIMHRDVVLLVAMPRSGIRSVGDLKGKRIGTVRNFNLNRALLEQILQRNDVDPNDVQRINIRTADLRTALAENTVDAIFTVGPITGNQINNVYQDIAAQNGETPVIIPIPDSEAIAQRNPLLEAFTILRGTFGGSPPRPAESVESLAITHRLVADRSIADSTITDLTKSLFEIRQSVAADVPAGARIEAPNTENVGPLVVHPGAAAYFDGEQKSFLEQYGEWIYIGVMVFGFAGSLGAAALSRSQKPAKPAGAGDLDRMLLLLRRTRLAKSFDELESLQQEADDAFAHIIERAAQSTIDEPVLSAFTIALGELRAAVEDRRRLLAHDQVSSLAE